jgi:ubiquinone/menaquinone biosynthesis C-methylase UbiE
MVNTLDIPQIDTIKTRMKATWSAGDYGTFDQYMAPGAQEILSSWRIPRGARLLDVGCGAGQIAIHAARAGVQATGVDIAANWVAQARARAAAEGLPAKFDEGDAENLPYPDASFDVVASMVGAMFAPRPELVAAELTRVCRPGGRILMVNWTPAGMVGQMFKAIGKHVPPPPGVPPASLWGDEATVTERFGANVKDLKLTKRFYPAWHYPLAVPQVVEFFRHNYGPINRAFAALDVGKQEQLRYDLEQVFTAHNIASVSSVGTTLLKSEYLDVSAVRV